MTVTGRNWDQGSVARRIDAYWEDEAEFRETLAADLARHAPLGDTLEIGCGSGRIYGALAAAGLVNPATYLGMDVSANMLAIAQARYPEVAWVTGDVHELPARAADTVLCIQVLQHLPAYHDALARLVAAARRRLYVVSWFGDANTIDLRRDDVLGEGHAFYQNVYELTEFLNIMIDLRPTALIHVTPLAGLAHSVYSEYVT